MSRSLKDYLGVFIRGVAMGAADVVPGVSGGTVAFITGIYGELIDSLKSCDIKAVQCLWQKGIPATWQHINGNFLLAVFSGIILSILSLAKVVTYCLEHQPILVWSAFFGLIAASSIILLKEVGQWNWQRVSSVLIGVVMAVVIATLKPAQLPETGWMMFAAGSVAICAMILPGVSGSFLLLMMGLYATVLAALSEANLGLLLPFVAGCGIGLLCFSHLLSWLLHRYHSATMAFLTGVLLGSLAIVWPWKHTLESTLDRHGEIIPLVQKNLMPAQYEALVGNPSQWTMALFAALVGFLIVILLEIISRKR